MAGGDNKGLVQFTSTSGLTEDDLRATIMIESGGDPKVENRFGFKGLLQLGEGRAKELGVEDPFDAAQSIEGYAKHAAEAKAKLETEGLPVDGFSTYLLWQQGLTGGSEILKSKDEKVRTFKYQRNMDNNPPPDRQYRALPDPSVGDWVDGWRRVFERRKQSALDVGQFFA
jgi:hypothetical protein